MMTFDPSNYDSIMSIADDSREAIMGWSGLRAVRASRVADNRMIVTGAYVDKAAADANAENARTNFGKMGEFMTEPPVQREGEVVWSYDADDQSKEAGYIRHLIYGFDISKYDALMSYWDTTTAICIGISGLIRIRLVRCQEPNNRMLQSAAYDSKQSDDADLEAMLAFMASFYYIVSDDPSIPP
ncbi:MAG: hypothetical protein H8D93_00020, partial [Verrucomicrobia bacterium]|nr:hypothetical protein [Verrucomicrobiota bacterium]